MTTLSIVVSGHRVTCVRCDYDRIYERTDVDAAIRDYAQHTCPLEREVAS